MRLGKGLGPRKMGRFFIGGKGCEELGGAKGGGGSKGEKDG